jgi:hypothetical protein
MAYVVDRVVICDAFREPDAHYELLPGGRSRRVATRRPSMPFLACHGDARQLPCDCWESVTPSGRG